jgi:DNA gyrase subunit A
VKGISLASSDEVIAAEILHETLPILTVTENGYGKRTEVDEYRVQARGGKGIITIQTSNRNGRVVGIRQVEETDSMILISNTGQIIRMPVGGVRIIGRNTQGVTLFRLSEDERIVSMARVAAEDDEDEEFMDGDAAADQVSEEASVDPESDGASVDPESDGASVDPESDGASVDPEDASSE